MILDDDDTIVDLSVNANKLGGTGVGNGDFTGQTYTIDNTGPAVINVTSSTANGTYAENDVISIQIIFSELVTVTGTPQLTLETGAINGVADYTSGTGTDTLTFEYTVVSTDGNLWILIMPQPQLWR